ncbi:IS5 family transposase [Terrimonas pollutisoli]|uniref:IS5 family transposase n=1 Tax=Terrimonas pollutisoli TaxID=3034147 RepID=UPI0023ED61F9|nr:IS5 family transposase [Terrimonas sp. H1YJ31]
MAKAKKNRASKTRYVSPNQLSLVGFESPFVQHLNPNNRWVVLARQIPWDSIVNVYRKQLNNEVTGAGGINPRVAIGALFIKHICDLSDRETILQIQENIYMQYFIGFSSYSDEPVFDSSLFVDIRKRLGPGQINEINERIMGIISVGKDDNTDNHNQPEQNHSAQHHPVKENEEQDAPKEASITVVNIDPPSNKGELLVDATACPQDIKYPTDLNLLNDARQKSEELIDVLYRKKQWDDKDKPRTYRQIARKEYLKVAQKKHKTRKQIRKAIRKQLAYLHRNIKILHSLLTYFKHIPFNKKDYKYLLVIQTLYDQQKMMYDSKMHTVEHRIVSIHQPHVRPIVRGKTNAYVEFGAKIQVSIMNGITFLEDLSWEAFNESTRLMSTIESYKRRFGYYPGKVMVDKIYCTRENRAKLKQLGIELRAKPLGRPKLAVDNHVRPGERNPIEGKFGQAKTTYGMGRIKARLQQTSESWIASIVLVLNLINLIGRAFLCLVVWLKQKNVEFIKWLAVLHEIYIPPPKKLSV